MKKYISLIILVMILTSCSTPQPGYYYKHHTRHQQKTQKKMKRVNKRPGKTYFIISAPLNNR
jgi:PBP1b-binding outer membrane lipoprotein LpoB